MKKRLVPTLLVSVGVFASVLAGCGGNDGDSGEGGETTATLEDLKGIVDAYNEETPLGTDCAWKAENWGGEQGASSLADGASASEELACKDVIPVVVADFGDEAKAADVAATLDSFQAGSLVVDGPAVDPEPFYEYLQTECGCGEVPAA